MPLEIGNKAPLFSLPAIDAKGQSAKISLKDYQGQKLVLYFYPKDDTPGCTAEAIAFTAHLKAFKAAKTAILGVSADTPEKHAKFYTKHNLAIALASDETHKMLEAYSVWVEKNMYGRKYMGIERASFLIDERGKIVQIWRRVKVKGHVEAVLKAAQDKAGKG